MDNETISEDLAMQMAHQYQSEAHRHGYVELQVIDGKVEGIRLTERGSYMLGTLGLLARPEELLQLLVSASDGVVVEEDGGVAQW